MSVHVRGRTSPVEQADTELDIQRKGTTATVTYKASAPGVDILQQLPAINNTHPVYRGLTLSQISIKKVKGLQTAVCTYDGEASSSPSGPTYEVQASPALQEAPIETHPKFLSWAGTPKKPKDGIFDDQGRFIGWQPTSKKFGVTSYLSPRVEITVTVQQGHEPDMTKLGTLTNSGRGLPKIGGKYNWMLVGLPYRTSGDGFSVSYVWMLSGKGGWDKDIYGK